MRPYAASLLAVYGLFTAQTNAMGLETESMTSASISLADTIVEYKFKPKRCTDKQKNKNGHPSQCETWCEGDDDDTIGCSWSYPIGDALKWKSDDAACRCNQRLYKYANKPAKDSKCSPACEADEKCHKSWPFYLKPVTKADKTFRCKAALSDDDGEHSIDDSGDNSDDSDTVVPPTEPTLLETSQCDQSDENDVQLCMHNQGRALHADTSAMTFKQSLADDAMAWSEYMAAVGFWGHSSSTSNPPRVGQGENLAVYYGGSTRHHGWSAEAWYKEIQDYDYDDVVGSWNDDSIMVGHFTQMVWTDSLEVGCGTASGNCPAAWNTSQQCVYTTCRYEPYGNVIYNGNVQQSLEDHVKPQLSAVTTQAAQITSRSQEEEEEESFEAIL